MKRLKNEADLVSAIRRGVRQVRERFTPIQQIPCAGLVHGPEHLKQSGFARSALPHDTDEFSTANSEIYASQCLHLAIIKRLFEPLGFKNAFGRTSGCSVRNGGVHESSGRSRYLNGNRSCRSV